MKSGKAIWSRRPQNAAVTKNIEKILAAGPRLPLQFWKPQMFFLGAGDKELFPLTDGRFPGKPTSQKSHPIFSLKELPETVGFKVCPCSSQIPYRQKKYRYIEKDCQLMHTRKVTDRKSYLIEDASFNIPPSVAFKLRFYGEVPEECLKSVKRKG